MSDHRALARRCSRLYEAANALAPAAAQSSFSRHHLAGRRSNGLIWRRWSRFSWCLRTSGIPKRHRRQLQHSRETTCSISVIGQQDLSNAAPSSGLHAALPAVLTFVVYWLITATQPRCSRARRAVPGPRPARGPSTRLIVRGYSLLISALIAPRLRGWRCSPRFCGAFGPTTCPLTLKHYTMGLVDAEVLEPSVNKAEARGRHRGSSARSSCSPRLLTWLEKDARGPRRAAPGRAAARDAGRWRVPAWCSGWATFLLQLARNPRAGCTIPFRCWCVTSSTLHDRPPYQRWERLEHFDAEVSNRPSASRRAVLQDLLRVTSLSTQQPHPSSSPLSHIVPRQNSI